MGVSHPPEAEPTREEVLVGREYLADLRIRLEEEAEVASRHGQAERLYAMSHEIDDLLAEAS